jgi:1,4-dihydroxy-6-naphthoate synthase
MFFALATGALQAEKYACTIERRDIEELNQLASQEFYDITALSFHALAGLTEKYALLSSGASMAEAGYGPMVVACEKPPSLKNKTVAIPGEKTTAALVLKLFEPGVHTVAMPFDQILGAVLEKRVAAGLLIHEGQLQYEEMGLKKIVGLMDFWCEFSQGLPLPLGGSAVKKSLGLPVMQDLSALQKRSIVYATQHHEAARDYALQFKRDLSPQQADLYLSWYANKRSIDLGEDGKRAIEFLWEQGFEKGLLPKKTVLEIV